MNKRDSTALSKRVLKPSAFPSVFEGLPTYYQKDVPVERSTETSSTARRAKTAEAQELASEEFLLADQGNINIYRVVLIITHKHDS